LVRNFLCAIQSGEKRFFLYKTFEYVRKIAYDDTLVFKSGKRTRHVDIVVREDALNRLTRLGIGGFDHSIYLDRRVKEYCVFD
jgi:hypothetical protein